MLSTTSGPLSTAAQRRMDRSHLKLHESPAQTPTSHPRVDRTDSLADHPRQDTIYDARRRTSDLSCNLEEQSQFVSQGVEDFPYHDFLTPEYSSENPYSEASPYTSPGLEDLLSDTTTFAGQMVNEQTGEAVFPATIRAFPTISGTKPSTDLPLNQLSGLGQLLSPHPTMTPSPPLPSKALRDAATPLDTRFMHIAPHHNLYQQSGLGYDVPLEARKVVENATNCAVDSDHIDPPVFTQPTSPMVTVSLHTRGDSPSRSKVASVRGTGKRSAASRSLEFLSPNEPQSGHNSQSSDFQPSTTSLLAENGSVDHHEGLQHRRGLNPHERADDEIPSVNDQADMRKLDERNADVVNWLATSETGSQAGEEEYNQPAQRRTSKDSRYRSGSEGKAKIDAVRQSEDDSHIPGPGVLVSEDSEDEHSTDESATTTSSPSESPVAEPETTLRQSRSIDVPAASDPLEDGPLPRQFISPRWDEQTMNNNARSVVQPPSSNAAMYRFEQMAAKFETASRAATWGTRRRMSESEINSIIEGNAVRHLSLSKKTDRRSSFISKLKLLRAPSGSKKKKSPSPSPSQTPRAENAHVDGQSSDVRRTASSGKSKSSSRYAGTALKTMASHISTASRVAPETPEAKGSTSGLAGLKRNRSRSEVPASDPKSSPRPRLGDLFTKMGGLPRPTLGSPSQHRRDLLPTPSYDLTGGATQDDDYEDDEEVSDGKGIRMDLDVRADRIIPTIEGFRTHALQLNPRLQPFLVDRIAHEQVRRYKKLVECKVKHARAIHVQRHCPSTNYCTELGGKATLLAVRPGARDSEPKHVQFQIAGKEQTAEDDAFLAEGFVTPALFPSGIPTPPVKQLPAEFECSLCFKVKKFLKPSDWTKHVHEDIQPFSCTFPNCPEPKSFKRKADWVRHENERHRHLEWWQCNIQDCNHICYRKDNFVQHLVREHKLPEPKLKTRGSGSSKFKRTDANLDRSDEVWKLLETCHYDNPARARDEACKFCGNVCNTWKKVSSHLGKHMEQIALPVLGMVEQREVSPDTVISPVEPLHGSGARNPGALFASSMMPGYEQESLSPYPASATSLYHDSSAGMSPAQGSDYAAQIRYLRRVQAASQSPHNVPLPHGMPTPAITAPGPLAYSHYPTEGMMHSVPMSNATYPLFQRPYQHPSPHLHQPVSHTHPAPHYPPQITSTPFHLTNSDSALFASPVDTRYKHQFFPASSQYPGPTSGSGYRAIPDQIPHVPSNGSFYQSQSVPEFNGRQRTTNDSSGVPY